MDLFEDLLCEEYDRSAQVLKAINEQLAILEAGEKCDPIVSKGYVRFDDHGRSKIDYVGDLHDRDKNKEEMEMLLCAKEHEERVIHLVERAFGGTPDEYRARREADGRPQHSL